MKKVDAELGEPSILKDERVPSTLKLLFKISGLLYLVAAFLLLLVIVQIMTTTDYLVFSGIWTLSFMIASLIQIYTIQKVRRIRASIKERQDNEREREEFFSQLK